MKITKLYKSFLIFSFLLFLAIVKGQHFESVAITGVASGNGSQNALFIVTCPTVPSLTRMRVEKVSGAGTVQISRQTTPAARTDNFTYTHNTGFTSGIPNNVSRMKITFLQTDGVTPIPANDFRLVIDDIDGPNNEGIYTDCGSSVRFTSLAIPTNLTLNTTPPNLGAVGTANENGLPPSRIMFEYNNVSEIFYTIYANNGFVKEFDLNYDDFLVDTPKFAVCVSDSDGDGIADNLDMDDDNDGILDLVECGGNDPNGDADGDGLPNYLDTLDNRIAANNFGGVIPANYISSRDSSVTNYTDADGDGVPDVYDSSADADSIPNHLDLDSDGDGCYDAVEGDENVTPAQLLGTGTINIASNGGVGTTVNVNNGVPNLVNSGGTADIGPDVGQGAGNSLNALLKDPLCYNLILTSDSGATATGTTGVAFTVPNILTNDTLDGVTPVIGSNSGQVAISQTGVWPAGITLNTATGQVNVGSSVPAGTYNVTYQVCVNGTSPALCTTTTVTIILKADSDGDLLADDIDLDDDNDGILDSVENNCPQVTLTNTNTNFSTLLAAGTVTVGGVNITATRTGTVNSFNGDAYIGAGAQINPGFSGTYTNAGGTSFNTPVTSASLTLNFSQPISTFTTSFKAMQDEEQITFSQPASIVVNQMNSTYGVAPSIMSLATLVNGGLELRSNLSGIVGSNTSSSFGSNSVVTWYFPVPISSLTINHTGVNRGTGVGLTNYNGSIIGGNFTFAQAVVCTPLDTDGDGIINSLDTDSDGDGCPDAIEGVANITALQITAGHINGAVDANGVPTAASGGQAIGQSQDAAKNDCSDVDADGVPDWQDLDNDNDGILDTVEAPCTSTQAQWSHNASGGQSDFVTFENDTTTTSPNFTSAANITFGAGLDEATDNYSYTYLLRGASTTNFADAKTANDYAQVSYTPSKKMTLKSLNFGYYSNSATDPEFNCGNFRMAVEYSTNPSFTSPILLLNDVQVGAMIAGGYVSINNAINNLVLQSGSTYYFRVYLYNEQNTDANNRVRVDDVFFNHCLFVDTDGDGISDDLDTDSDGDGCPDAIEGAANITASQVTSGYINGTIDANGVPTAVSGGQAIGQSQDAAKNDCLDTDGDGYPNWQDLDDDNDGILDTAEVAVCGIPVLFNENFGTGNRTSTAFTTYTYEPLTWDPIGNTGNGIDDGEYAIVNSIDDTTAQWSNCYWVNTQDHTPSDTNGRMALYNATFTPGEFYRHTNITVTPNIYVNIGFWVKNVDRSDNCDHQNNRILPDISVQIQNSSNAIITQFDTGAIPKNEGWNYYNYTFNTGANTNLQFVLYNHANGGLGNDIAIDDIVLRNICDLDGDGIPNDLDTDSDGDGCPDAIEGDENVLVTQLNVNGSINITANGGVNANGVPNLVNSSGTADVGADEGQGIGSSENAAINSCYCYKPAQTTGTTLDSNHGITALSRAGDDNSNWPMVRKGAWTVMEAKTKGFVVNRLTDAQVAAIPAANLREGMMVYNITQDCLQINVDGTATGWRCFNTQTCPD